MNRQIARLGIVMLVAYTILFAQLNRLTVFGAQRLQDDPNNSREIERDFDSPRGRIVSADGVLLAESVPAEGIVTADDGTVLAEPGDSRFTRQRVYPTGELFSHVVGYYSLSLGASGLEKEYNDELAGRTLDLRLRDLADLFVQRDRVGDLTLTVRADAQVAAQQALGDRAGSVVAIEPTTGAVLAMYSSNTFDPNSLADHDFATARQLKAFADSLPDKPLLAKTHQERYFPGSTFKVVTAAAGLEAGSVTVDEPVYPRSNGYVPPQTSNPIRNFGDGTCGGNLIEILRVSCNTAFAQMAVELGPDAMVDTAEAFGFNDTIPIDLPDPAESKYPTDFTDDTPKLAQTGIGQNDVQATPLQMALVAATVANNGVAMTPHVVDQVTDDEGNIVDHNDPRSWKRPISSATAATLRTAMEDVVARGTARSIQLPGMIVGGKTGTAELGGGLDRSHAWMIAYAGPPGVTPTVAIAVIIEATPERPNLSGGRDAGPVARAVLATILAGP